MKFITGSRRVHQLVRAVHDGTLIPQPPFQRRVVWTTKDQVRFLETVLKGYPFPEIYIAAGEFDIESAKSTEHLVDGQQRITTLYNYFFGSPDLKLPRTFSAFQALSSDQQKAFLEYEVAVRDLGIMTEAEIVEVFERINATQYSLNDTEIQHARFTGDFMQLALKVSEHELFQLYRVFTPQHVRRMHDVNFCLSLLITAMSTYFNRESSIEEYLKRYNEDFEESESIYSELQRVLNFIISCDLDAKSRFKNRSDLFTLIVELHRILVREHNDLLSPVDVKKRLEHFYSEVENRDEEMPLAYIPEVLEGYYQAAVQATNDRGNRIRRGRIISQVLKGVPPKDISVSQQANPTASARSKKASESS